MSTRFQILRPGGGRQSWRAHLRLLVPLLLLLSVPGSPRPTRGASSDTDLARSSATAGWKKIGEQEGITLWTKDKPGRAIPVFKGRTEIDAPMYQLLAILADPERAVEWNSRVAALRLLERASDFDFRFYVRIRAPWPANDRDVVLATELTREENGERLIAWFRGDRRAATPVPDGVVRFERLTGIYRLQRLAPGKTLVEYEIDGDPGGWLPGWLISYSVRGMPLDALRGLRRQAARTRGQYDAFVSRHDPQARARTSGAAAATASDDASGGRAEGR